MTQHRRQLLFAMAVLVEHEVLGAALLPVKKKKQFNFTIQSHTSAILIPNQRNVLMKEYFC